LVIFTWPGSWSCAWRWLPGMEAGLGIYSALFDSRPIAAPIGSSGKLPYWPSQSPRRFREATTAGRSGIEIRAGIWLLALLSLFAEQYRVIRIWKALSRKEKPAFFVNSESRVSMLAAIPSPSPLAMRSRKIRDQFLGCAIHSLLDRLMAHTIPPAPLMVCILIKTSA